MAYKNIEDQKAACKAHYEKNKSTYKARARAWNKAQKAKVRRFLSRVKNHPCVDCGGEFHHAAMDFDHVRGDKDFCISNAMRGQFSMKRLKNELRKCELVCSNCHRVRTYKRLNDL
jgi:hypothetical protein